MGPVTITGTYNQKQWNPEGQSLVEQTTFVAPYVHPYHTIPHGTINLSMLIKTRKYLWQRRASLPRPPWHGTRPCNVAVIVIIIWIVIL